jgi:hypothetical protein
VLAGQLVESFEYEICGAAYQLLQDAESKVENMYHVVCRVVESMLSITDSYQMKDETHFVKNAHCPTNGHPRIFFMWLLSDVARYQMMAAALKAAAVPATTLFSEIAATMSACCCSSSTGKEEFMVSEYFMNCRLKWRGYIEESGTTNG